MGKSALEVQIIDQQRLTASVKVFQPTPTAC